MVLAVWGSRASRLHFASRETRRAWDDASLVLLALVAPTGSWRVRVMNKHHDQTRRRDSRRCQNSRHSPACFRDSRRSPAASASRGSSKSVIAFRRTGTRVFPPSAPPPRAIPPAYHPPADARSGAPRSGHRAAGAGHGCSCRSWTRRSGVPASRTSQPPRRLWQGHRLRSHPKRPRRSVGIGVRRWTGRRPQEVVHPKHSDFSGPLSAATSSEAKSASRRGLLAAKMPRVTIGDASTNTQASPQQRLPCSPNKEIRCTYASPLGHRVPVSSSLLDGVGPTLVQGRKTG